MKENESWYTQYLNSQEWIAQKEIFLSIYNRNNWETSCLICHSILAVQAHHNYYIKPLKYVNISDIDFLCSNCHSKWHNKHKQNWMQNERVKENIDYYFSNISADETNQLAILLKNKIEYDKKIIESYFNKENVLQYSKMRKIGSVFQLFLVIAFFVFFVNFLVGAGIIVVLILIGKAINDETPIPSDYEGFIEKKKSLYLKEKALSSFLK